MASAPGEVRTSGPPPGSQSEVDKGWDSLEQATQRAREAIDESNRRIAQQAAQEAQQAADNTTKGAEAGLEVVAAQPATAGESGNIRAGSSQGNYDVVSEAGRVVQSATETRGAGGIKPPEAPPVAGTQPNGEQRPQSVQPESAAPASEMSEEDRLFAKYENISPLRLQNSADGIQRRIDNLRLRADRSASDSDWEMKQGQINRLQDELDLIEKIQDERGDEVEDTNRGERSGARQTREEKREEKDEADRQAREKAEYIRKLNKFSVDELEAEGQSEDAVIKALRKELEGARTTADREAINRRLTEAEGRLEAISSLKESKSPEETKKKDEREALEKEAELLKLRAETATASDIIDFQNTITGLQGEISGFEASLANLNESVLSETDEARKTELKKQRDEARANLVDARGRLKTYESALNTAKTKVREAQGSDTAINAESIRNMSPAEYGRLSKDEKIARLQELAGSLPPLDKLEYEALQAKIRSGEFSQNELGQFVGYTADRLVAGDRSVLTDIATLSARYGEVQTAVLAKAVATKEGNRALKEAFPSNWEKILAFAKKNKGLSVLLLMILAGIIAGVTGGVGPAAIAAVGAGAGAGGAAGLSRS